MVTETIQYYTENGYKGVFLLLLDASKAFDKVVFHMLFNAVANPGGGGGLGPPPRNA